MGPEALATYRGNRTETRNLALESSPLYEPVAKLVREGVSRLDSTRPNYQRVLPVFSHRNMGKCRKSRWWQLH